MEPQTLSLGCEALDDFRVGMDTLLRNMVREMEQKDLSSGILTGKIKVEMRREIDQDGLMETIIEIEPKLNVKIGEDAKVEMAKKNSLILRFDVSGTPVIGTNQISMDEMLQDKAG